MTGLPPTLPPVVAPVRSRPAGGSVVLVEKRLPTLLPLQQGVTACGKTARSRWGIPQRDAEALARSAQERHVPAVHGRRDLDRCVVPARKGKP